MNPDQLFDPTFNQLVQPSDVDVIKEYLIKKSGWIYIAKSSDNGHLKIGRTGKNPLERAKTLSTTGVFNDYHILFALKVFNQYMSEINIHKKLKKFRLTNKKEFFAVNQDLALKSMQEVYERELFLLNRFFDTKIVEQDINLLPDALRKL